MSTSAKSNVAVTTVLLLLLLRAGAVANFCLSEENALGLTNLDRNEKGRAIAHVVLLSIKAPGLGNGKGSDNQETNGDQPGEDGDGGSYKRHREEGVGSLVL